MERIDTANKRKISVVILRPCPSEFLFVFMQITAFIWIFMQRADTCSRNEFQIAVDIAEPNRALAWAPCRFTRTTRKIEQKTITATIYNFKYGIVHSKYSLSYVFIKNFLTLLSNHRRNSKSVHCFFNTFIKNKFSPLSYNKLKNPIPSVGRTVKIMMVFKSA